MSPSQAESCQECLSPVPDLLDIHRRLPERWPYLLASTAQGGRLGRWSLLLFQDGPQLILNNTGELSGPGKGRNFLDRLRSWTTEHGRSLATGNLPFYSGWFVYLGYELAGQIEPRLRLPAATDRLPVALASRCPAALVHDHRDDVTWLVAQSDSALRRASDSLVAPASRTLNSSPSSALKLQASDGQEFIRGVKRIRDWILAGDVFQVNLSRCWRGRAPELIDPVAIYAALTASNPAPFAGLARLPGGTVLSSSPERLVEIRNGQVQTRPIAGTRPRGLSASDDALLSAELMAHPKERAEHIMLIDLERNDLGRVCEAGSVEVDELMVVESYAHVHHIVSNVRGRLRSGMTPTDVIAAVFPGGTITGCPKIRCMEIIAELEGEGRSFYTGAMGYIGDDGAMDLNILIRSMAVSGRELSFRTGAGIVADSDPDSELAETEAKARGLLRALNQ